MKFKLLVFLILLSNLTFSQFDIKWSANQKAFYEIQENKILKTDLSTGQNLDWFTGFLDKKFEIKDFVLSENEDMALVYTNSKKVWRYETRGDYWFFDTKTKALKQIGIGLPASSLMFAKFSPDGQHVAYVSEHNVYVEQLSSGKIKKLTDNSKNKRIINGTFDWVYEEEFDCRDGFRWSPDSKCIAFWQIDASTIRDFMMINNTDSIYSYNVPVEYPKVGQAPSGAKIGVVDIKSGKNTWMQIPGETTQNYLPRMDWNGSKLIVQQLNRRQNHSKVYEVDPKSAQAKVILEEKNTTWIDVNTKWDEEKPSGWLLQENGFMWISEKDGFRHIFKEENGKETLITKGNFDVMEPAGIDKERGILYFYASPGNATQKYLYSVNISGNEDAKRVTPMDQPGTHIYNISKDGKFAFHIYSSHNQRYVYEFLNLETGKAMGKDIASQLKKEEGQDLSFFIIKLDDGTSLDAWMVKPANFDPNKKYPIVMSVYGEPAAQTVVDRWGTGMNRLYDGNMAADGYIYASIDNRGTPAPKGAAWRKAIYKNIGQLNIQDQANGLKKMLEMFPFIDASRVAVHGWSGGGSSTCNLLFQYPNLYQTGIAVAAVANQLTYDNIYQERYMGLIDEGDKEFFVKGSPVTHAKNLKGNLLYIHGTGDDNVHYQNAEMLINELIKNKKQFSMMAYPNRTHSINEGEGTTEHLRGLFTKYLKDNCTPGAR